MADEKELFALVKQGDVKAYESIFKSFYQPLCGYACTMLSELEEAVEAVQQVFVQVWDKRARIEIENSVKAYLYRAVRNECLNRLKHAKVKRMYQQEAMYEGDTGIDSTTETVAAMELEHRINAAVGGLPEQCRLIFQLSRYEGKKYQEIADELGLSVKTVENQIGKALRIMREKLVEYLPVFVSLLFHLTGQYFGKH